MDCKDKRKMTDENWAILAMRKAHKRGLINIRYYKCDECGFYHLTKGELKNVSMDQKTISE